MVITIAYMAAFGTAGHIVPGLMVLIVCIYHFYAVQRRDVISLTRSQYALGASWLVYLVLGCSVVLSLDYQSIADQVNAQYPNVNATADNLRQLAGINLAAGLVTEFIYLAIIIGVTQQYKTYLVRVKNNQNVINMGSDVRASAPTNNNFKNVF
jgi:hypothetical protein